MSLASINLYGVERPSRVAVARRLASVAASLPGPDNFERTILRSVVDALNVDPPDMLSALCELHRGMRHAFRADFVEDGPESWICAACLELLDRSDT